RGLAVRTHPILGARGFFRPYRGEQKGPARASRPNRQNEVDRLLCRVEHDEQWSAASVPLADHVGEIARLGKPPVDIGHLGPARGEPEHIVRAVRPAPDQPMAWPELRMLAAQFREAANELGEIVSGSAEPGPIDPADLVVLAKGVVVALLAVGDLIAC